MTVKQQEYRDIRQHMQPGDIIAFGGTSPFSELIKFSTRSAVSHVAVVLQTKMLDDDNDRFFNQVVEATSYNGLSGVMINRLSDRVSTYPGDMWWLPLGSTAREKMQSKRKAFFDFLLKQEHKPYDLPQALMSAVDETDDTPLIRKITHNAEDYSSFFCSELVSAALEMAGIVENVNASEVTPIDLCRFNIFDQQYVHFKAEEGMKKISGFNCLTPTGWGA